MSKIIVSGNSAYLEGIEAFAFTKVSSSIFIPSDNYTSVGAQNKDAQFKVVNWGKDNKLPTTIREMVEKSTDMGAAMLFNIAVSYGEGVIPVRWKYEGNKRTYQVVTDPEVVDFFDRNNINSYLIEQITDMHWFYNCFPEIILDKAGRKILELNHKEAEFSRLSEMNEKGMIDYHFYSAKWATGATKEYVEATSLLDPKRLINSLEEKVKGGDRRFIIPINFPTPGRTYYQKPYWYSLFESGWYDFAIAIPEFKKAMLKNLMGIKYFIEIDEKYWTLIFDREGITSDEGKETRVKEEYKRIQDFLVGEKNAGKAWITPKAISLDGKDNSYIKISEYGGNLKGGEYLADASDVSNTIAYAMGVHSGLIGSSPGKNSGSLSGTDKREMFTIKQALIKPFRDVLLTPFYVIKKFNNWPSDIDFVIPNIVLTGLDENKTGSTTAI